MPQDYKTSFAIKAPSRSTGAGKRRTFAIQEVRGDERRTLELEAVGAVNKAWLAEEIDRNEAVKQITAIRDRLYKERDAHEPQLAFLQDNLDLLKRYWRSEYTGRDVVDPKTAWDDLKRAVYACGTVPLLAGSREDLQETVDTHTAGNPNKQRRVVSRLNQLLRFAGREFKLRKQRRVRVPVKYLTWAELQSVLPHLPDDNWRTFAKALWVTGCRVGELFAVTSERVQQDQLWVDSQVDVRLRRRDTKSRKDRWAYILREEEGQQVLQDWLSIDLATRNTLRKARHSVVIKRACKKALKSRLDKHCNAHCLRHSYAVDIVSTGVNLTFVSLFLGNSVLVCEMYYSGFIATVEAIATVRMIMRRRTQVA